jgi:hypothetical protein
MVVPRFLTGLVGRAFFRAVRKVPPLFLLVCLGGIALGFFCLLDHSEANKSKLLFLRILGVWCILFYGWFSLLFLRKISGGTWRAFCDKYYEFFADY